MSFEDDLKNTLNRTLELAISLEQVNLSRSPREIGERARKRILSISGDIKSLSTLMRQNGRSISDIPSSVRNGNIKINRPSIIEDTPVFKTNKKLSFNIQETNQRLRQNRAGKKTVSNLIENNACPPLYSTRTSLINESSKNLIFTSLTEKPLPYVSILNGKVEPPLQLPTYSEYLKSMGCEFYMISGKNELINRINKAKDQLDSLKFILENRLSPKRTTQTRHKLTRGRNLKAQYTKVFNNQNESENIDELITKTHEVRNNIERLYSKKNKLGNVTDNAVNDYVSPEESLNETLRSFYQSKACENQKLVDILDRMKVDRPKSLKKKIFMIQGDSEKYKNQLHSIKKFDGFKESLEIEKRKTQLLCYRQGLFYLRLLDNFRYNKQQLSLAELSLLNNWKNLVEGGILITSAELAIMKEQLDLDDLNKQNVKDLLHKFVSNIS